jgi:nucleoside-diphosphate-sugar epimerase
MHVLLVGGTGNISTDCAALLARRGHQISVVTRGRVPVPDGYGKIVADRNDRDALASALGGVKPDVVVDFLAFTPAQLEVDLAVFGGKVAQLVLISSATVYAKPHPVPVTEEAPLGNAWSEYARNKQACEEWLAGHAERLPFTIVRPSHTYSLSWIPNVVASAGYTFADRMLKGRPVFVPDDGQALWTLTTARDFAVGLAGLVGNEAALGERFHVTSDAPLTWNQIYAEVARALGVEAPAIERIPTDFACDAEESLVGKLKGDKAHAAVFDNAKIKRFVPDFECRDSIRDGITAAVKWFDEHPDMKTVDAKVDAVWDAVIAAWRRTW